MSVQYCSNNRNELITTFVIAYSFSALRLATSWESGCSTAHGRRESWKGLLPVRFMVAALVHSFCNQCLALAFGWGLKLVFYYGIVIVFFCALFTIVSIVFFFMIQLFICQDEVKTLLIINLCSIILFILLNIFVFDRSLLSLFVLREPILGINLLHSCFHQSWARLSIYWRYKDTVAGVSATGPALPRSSEVRVARRYLRARGSLAAISCIAYKRAERWSSPRCTGRDQFSMRQVRGEESQGVRRCTTDNASAGLGWWWKRAA